MESSRNQNDVFLPVLLRGYFDVASEMVQEAGNALSIAEKDSVREVRESQFSSQSGDDKDFIIWTTNIEDLELHCNRPQESPSLTIHMKNFQSDIPSFQSYMMALTHKEYKSVNKYRSIDDKKRALLSILLQKSLIQQKWKIRDSDYEILRTPQNKPYMHSSANIGSSWNYNVSHHGNFVCIASHSKHLIGIDIVDIETRKRGANAALFIEMFRKQLTDLEMRTILRESDDISRYSLFFVHWALKEAFIKAVGMGLGFDLQEVCNLHTTHTIRTAECTCICTYHDA